ncbi:MAG TPA: hypothetical protein VF467_00365 [Afipia sp.]
MRVVRCAMLVAVLTFPAAIPASAQFVPGFKLGEERPLTEDEIARNKANEDAAKAARAKIPDAKPSSDPWASVRTEPAPKQAKAKTTSK